MLPFQPCPLQPTASLESSPQADQPVLLLSQRVECAIKRRHFAAPKRSKARTEVRAICIQLSSTYAVANNTISVRARMASAAARFAVSPKIEFTTSTAL